MMKTTWLRAATLALTGLAVVALSGCGGPSVNLEGDLFRVVHASPTHGAVDVALDVIPVVGFSVPVAESSDQEVVLSRIDGTVPTLVEVSRFFVDEGHVIELLPRQLLVPGGTYEITATAEVLAEDGTSLSAPFHARFVTTDAEGG
jgi:hypothetical protein